MAPPVRLLVPFAQNYDWGKLGSTSWVAKLLQDGYGKLAEEHRPYAELWIGDHPNGPSGVLLDGATRPISEFLSEEDMGSFKFLFKVLSVRKALSIQSHPDASLAQQLHAERPDIYKDPNPKPELAVALTPFRALFGFRPLCEILSMFDSLPGLSQLVPVTLVERLRSASATGSPDASATALKEVYSFVMHCSSSDVETTIRSVLRMQRSHLAPAVAKAVALADELNMQFPGGDVGVLSVFVLNIVDLGPGECLFMGPNVPHAYLSGDLIECMTCSDNVIRGGLTPKFKDLKTLISSLDFTCTVPALLPPKMIDDSFPCWSPPDVPFAVTRYEVSDKAVDIQTTASGPSVALFMSGAGSLGDFKFKGGQCILLSPGETYTLDCTGSGADMFLAFTPA